MTDSLTIRETTAEDAGQIQALYSQAFPEEELRPVVSALLKEAAGVVSLAGFDGDELVAHVLFSASGIGGNQGGALLAPLAVKPSHQRQGVG
ncbi:MAG: GNAT family N-acetyltransferase, partial [Pseudomonadota bacterium]